MCGTGTVIIYYFFIKVKELPNTDPNSKPFLSSLIYQKNSSLWWQFQHWKSKGLKAAIGCQFPYMLQSFPHMWATNHIDSTTDINLKLKLQILLFNRNPISDFSSEIFTTLYIWLFCRKNISEILENQVLSEKI
jgi:hypothetical protein